MDVPKLIARYHMPTTGWGETRSYDGRVHIVLTAAASSALVDWCTAQPNVSAAEVGTIEPTSLAIYLEKISSRPDQAANRIWDFLREFEKQLGQRVNPEPVTTVHSSLERLRQQGPPAYTREMQFLTEVYRRPGIPFRQERQEMSFAAWQDLEQTQARRLETVLAERKPYGVRRWRHRGLKAWLRSLLLRKPWRRSR